MGEEEEEVEEEEEEVEFGNKPGTTRQDQFPFGKIYFLSGGAGRRITVRLMSL